jgi:hypothetical protein
MLVDERAIAFFQEGDRFSLEIDRVTELKIINGSSGGDRRGRLKLLWRWLRVPGS